MPLRKAVFWVHLVCGLAVGTVVLMMSVTGVILTYEKQMEEWADREFWGAPAVEGRAPAGTLVASASAYAHDASVRSIMYYGGEDGPAAVSLRDGRILYMDPSTAEVRGVGSVAIRSFFSDVMRWHRWFNVRDEDRAFARAITGWSNLVFLFLVLSGLYLWVPRRISWQHFRAVLLYDRKAKGKARDFNWHHVFGFWSAIPLALVVASASVISFPWASDLAYRVVGDEPPRRAAARTAPPPTAPSTAMAVSLSSGSTGVAIVEDEPAPFDPGDLDPLIAPAMDIVDDWRLMTVTVPSDSGDPVSIRIDEGWGGEPQKRTTVTFDSKLGTQTGISTFEDQSRGRQFRTYLRFAHTGEYYGLAGQTVAGIVTFLSILLVWSGFALAWRRLVRPILKARATG